MVGPVSHLPSPPNTTGKRAIFLALTLLVTGILGFRRAQASPPPVVAMIPSSVSVTPQTTPQLTVYEKLTAEHDTLHKQALNCAKLPLKEKRALLAKLQEVGRKLEKFNR